MKRLLPLLLALAACSAQPVPPPARGTLPSQPPVLEAAILPTQDPGELTSAAFGGTATWYCGHGSPCTRGYGPSDMVAAIDPTTGIRKGERLTVRHEGRSVTVRVVDVCACSGSRLIDLTSGAFSRLAPLSEGVIPVSIQVSGPAPTPPTTDSEGGNR